MEWIQLINKLEQLCYIDQRPSNQSISIPHLEHIELWTTLMIVWQKPTCQPTTWTTRLMPCQSERP
jgi:hypothetical protein